MLKLLMSLNRAGEIYQCYQITAQWQELTWAYLGARGLLYPFRFETRDGQKIVLNSFHDLVTVWVIFCRQEYKIPGDAQVVIDAGANIGTFSIYACNKNVKEIYAIEPFPETFNQLQKNIDLNGLKNKVKLKALALAKESGNRLMDLNNGPSQSRGLLKKNDSHLGLKVPTLTLADFLKSINKEEIDLLKIDIEGGEHEVFHNSDDQTLKKIKHIAMEYHPNESKSALFDRLEKANFKLTHDFSISAQSGVAYFSRQ